MKLRKETIEQFYNEKDKLLETIEIFSEGISFPQKYDKKEECTRTSWITDLKSVINDIDLENGVINGRELTTKGVRLGAIMSLYVLKMENIIKKEFGKIIPPFDRILEQFLYRILDIKYSELEEEI